MQRKLAAIVAGDIVGYSRSMEQDESGTYAALRAALDEVIEPSLHRHGGRTVKSTGDGFLATFPSVNEALDAAIEIQAGFADRPFALRIGVNLGDVIEADGDMFGDGVNVAARLEAMADPGRIFVSAAVVRSADRNRSAHFERVGRRRVKNIVDALDVYAVKATDSSTASWRSWLPLHGRGISVAAAALVLIAGSVLAFSDHRALVSLARSTVENSAWLTGGERIESRPVVAVLPFDNMSGDAGETYFVDGLTEDIIAELARNSELQVIARNSTFALRGQAADIREIGERLGATYLVEGSARRSGDQLRVVAQLIDTRSGAHLWSRGYDRRIDDVFAVQADLTAEIVAHLTSYVRQSEVADAANRPTESLQAYDLVLRARSHYKQGDFDREGLLAARALLQRALELDPGYAAARAYLGATYIVDALRGPGGPESQAGIEIGLSEARQAIRLDPTLAIGYQVLSHGLIASADYEGSIRAAHNAVELNPNDPDSLMSLAKAQVRFGDYDQAVSNAERARRLHPLAPAYYTYVHGQALYAAGRTEEADRVLAECLLLAPREPECLLIRTALLIDRGEAEQARATMARLVEAKPDFSIAAERAYRRFGESPLMERFLAALGNASAPESSDRRSAAVEGPA